MSNWGRRHKFELIASVPFWESVTRGSGVRAAAVQAARRTGPAELMELMGPAVRAAEAAVAEAHPNVSAPSSSA